MNEIELKKLISSGETEMVEFKEIPNNSFFEAISAFANTKGGVLLIGVDKNGNIKGVDPSPKFLEDLTNRIVNKLSIYPEIEVMEVDNERVMIVKVPNSSYPVSYDGRYFERVGNTSREISQQKLKTLLIKGQSWDSITGNFSIEEIDKSTVKTFVNLAVESKRLTSLSLKDSVGVILSKLGLMIDGKITNGAVLLFGKNPQKYFVNLSVRIGRFKTETTIIDDKWATGNLFKQFEETENILKQLINVRYEINDFYRKDIWDYPISALREVVLNALIHRDYFNIANFILIKVYDDRIWFYNPGRLTEGITIGELKKQHGSFLRNPLIGKVFYLAGLIEQYGSGTVRIVEWMKEADLPEPEYREGKDGFSVYFYKDIYTEENLRKMGLSDRQIKAVEFVKERGKITNKDYQKEFLVSKPTATRELSKLTDIGLLEKRGVTGKGTFYRLIKGSQRAHMAHKGLTKGSKR